MITFAIVLIIVLVVGIAFCAFAGVVLFRELNRVHKFQAEVQKAQKSMLELFVRTKKADTAESYKTFAEADSLTSQVDSGNNDNLSPGAVAPIVKWPKPASFVSQPESG